MMKLSRVLLLVAGLWSPALADTSASVDAPSVLCGERARIPQCGILGPPCCLGDRLLFPPARTTPLPSLVNALAFVTTLDVGEGRRLLATVRAALPKRDLPKLEQLLRREPRTAPLVSPPQ